MRCGCKPKGPPDPVHGTAADPAGGLHRVGAPVCRVGRRRFRHLSDDLFNGRIRDGARGARAGFHPTPHPGDGSQTADAISRRSASSPRSVGLRSCSSIPPHMRVRSGLAGPRLGRCSAVAPIGSTGLVPWLSRRGLHEGIGEGLGVVTLGLTGRRQL